MQKVMLPAVYITASGKNETLYTGVTSNLPQRIWQHKNGFFKGFSLEHRCNILVYYAVFDTMEQAITMEKRIKKWHRYWKIELIEQENPGWHDLYDSILD